MKPRIPFLSCFALSLVALSAYGQSGNNHPATGGAAAPPPQQSSKTNPAVPHSAEQPGASNQGTTGGQTDSNPYRGSVAPGGYPAAPSKASPQRESENAAAKSSGKTHSGPAGRGGSGEPNP